MRWRRWPVTDKQESYLIFQEPKPSTVPRTNCLHVLLAPDLLCSDFCAFCISYSLDIELSLFSACFHMIMPDSSFRHVIIGDLLQEALIGNPYTHTPILSTEPSILEFNI